jgi:hypothetical protein
MADVKATIMSEDPFSFRGGTFRTEMRNPAGAGSDIGIAAEHNSRGQVRGQSRS